MARYTIWTDSESYIHLPKGFKKYYNSIDAAYDAAANFVHQYDGCGFGVIIHVDDVSLDETIDTVENFIGQL